MLTGLRLGNFKPFAATQRLPIRPLTLIFCANSSGKSSLIHGLILFGGRGNTFILETHSEHLILQILRRIRESTDGEMPPGLTPICPEHVAVLYVLPDRDGAKVVEIPIRPDGEFAERWPQGFFAERAKELF
jgi:predicted ATPase